MTTTGRIALLMLGVSALPLPAAAASSWVYGVAERETAEAEEDSLWAADAARAGAQPPQALRRPRPAPAPAPAPTPTPPPPSGTGILVAILDTGIDLDHPEFAGRIAAGGRCFGTAAACAGAAALGDDNNGHGTHVAGIVASAANGVGNTGVAPSARLLPVKVLDAGGSGTYSAIASGLTYAAQSGARVINMSLGGSSPSSTLIAPLQQAAATAVIVAAAGNSGNAYAPGYPAAYATQAGIVGSMIVVGSVGPTNVISSFSQTPGNGGCVAVSGVTTCLKDVFLVAPGQSIYSAYPGGGYATMSGTSMATPYVAGVAARVLAASPYLTPKQVASILFQSATDLGARGTDAVYGRGLVNLQAALAPLGTQSVATSGVSTASFTGTGSVSRAGLSGVLAAGLQSSTLAKNVVFFDAYGRDYRMDLSVAASPGALSIEGIVAQGGGFWHSVSFVGDGYALTGSVTDEPANAIATAGFAERTTADFSDVVLRMRLNDDTALVLGRNASLTSLEATDTGPFLSASAMNSPFLALTEDAEFAALSTKLGQDLTVSFAFAATEDDATKAFADEILTAEEALSFLTQDPSHAREATNAMAGLNWRAAPWAQFGAQVAHTNETNSLLGSEEQGALALTAEAETTSLGLTARFDLGGDWSATASWSRGETQATPVVGSLYNSISGLTSEAYGLAIAKRGIFGDDDAIGLAVSRPLHIVSGTAVMTASTGVTEEREIIYTTEVQNLASATPETDYELGYTAKLGDALTFQAAAIYQQNAGGIEGEDAIAAVATLKGSW